MGRRTFTAEQTIFKLREVEALVGQGERSANACRKIAATEQTHYRWRRKYREMGTKQLKRLNKFGKGRTPIKNKEVDIYIVDMRLPGMNGEQGASLC